MIAKAFDALRNKYVALQIWALVIYLVLDAFGFGLGVLHHIFNRPLTSTGKFHIGDLIVGAPPAGPNRLSNAERAAVTERISVAFNGAPPAYKLLPDMTAHYQPKNVLCHFRGANIARGPQDCNAIREASRFYLALLRHMHPRTEALFYVTAIGYKGDNIAAAFFPDQRGKPKILIDLTSVRDDLWNRSLGYKLKLYTGDGVAEISLKGTEQASGLFLIDDPGVLKRRDASCDRPSCVARLLLYAHDYKGFRNAATGVLSTNNLADIEITAHLEKRFALYAAALGKVVPAPKPVLDMSYKPEKIAVTNWHTTHLKVELDAVMGTGSTSRALFSPIGYHVPFASVYGFILDGKRHLIWDGGPRFPSRGADHFVFHWKTERGLEPVTPIGGAGRLWVLPPPPPHLRRPTLLIHKSSQ